MKVREIMSQDVETVGPEATLQEAAERMSAVDAGALPVVGDDGALGGILTDRDIAVRGVAEGRDVFSARVRDIMTSEVVVCWEDEEVEQAAALMAANQVRRLVVLDRERRLVGIVSLGDLALDTPDALLSGRVLRQVSQPGFRHDSAV